MGQERAWQGQEAQDGLGLTASSRIPVADAGQIGAGYCPRCGLCEEACPHGAMRRIEG